RLVILGAVALEDRDQRRGERAGHDQLEDRIRDAERGEVRVELTARAELRPDDQKAQPPQRAAPERRDGQDQASLGQDPTRGRAWGGVERADEFRLRGAL